MLRITDAQINRMDETIIEGSADSIWSEMVRRHTDLHTHDDRITVDAAADALRRTGFDAEADIVDALDLIFQIGQRTDVDAPNARAIADAILSDDRHTPRARIAFLKAQDMSAP